MFVVFGCLIKEWSFLLAIYLLALHADCGLWKKLEIIDEHSARYGA